MNVRHYEDETYASYAGREMKFDLSVPESDGPVPLLIDLFGGGWKFGTYKNKPKYREIVARKIAFASIEYRLSGEAPFPAQIRDCLTAVRFFKKHADRYLIDGTKIGISGGSAGGHLAALVGLAPDFSAFSDESHYPETDSGVQAVVCLAGPSDIPTLFSNVRSGRATVTDRMRAAGVYTEEEIERIGYAAFGRNYDWFCEFIGGDIVDKKEAAEAASPLNYVGAGAPPFLIMHGDSDCGVHFIHSYKLHEALLNAGVASELVVVPNTPHVISHDLDGSPNDWIYERIYEFLGRILNGGAK